MSTSFIDLFSESGASCSSVACKGYAASELQMIGRLYNINIDGQLELFLSEIGRSDGGVMGDSSIPLYRPSWRVRQHLLFQNGFFNDMQEAGHFGYLNKPFVFAWISETQYYFVQTSGVVSDKVYHFDSNTDMVRETEWDLMGCIKKIVEWEVQEPKVCASSDLLKI
jgi:hypothetical protein